MPSQLRFTVHVKLHKNSSPASPQNEKSPRTIVNVPRTLRELWQCRAAQEARPPLKSELPSRNFMSWRKKYAFWLVFIGHFMDFYRPPETSIARAPLPGRAPCALLPPPFYENLAQSYKIFFYFFRTILILILAFFPFPFLIIISFSYKKIKQKIK